jgi:predicted nucleic acid-binding protein
MFSRHEVPALSGGVMATKPNEPLVFIDASVFIRLYGGVYSKDIESLLDSVRRERERIITNDQLLIEVIKHRGEHLAAQIKKLALEDPPSHFMSDGSRAATKSHTAKIRKHLDTAKRKAVRVLEQPARYDPIFKLLVDLVNKGGDLGLRIEDALFEKVFARALQRFHLNRPPISKRASCGDSLHWEWLVHCAKQQRRDVTIVTDDTDFAHDYLPFEFKRRTKRQLRLAANLRDVITVTQRGARAYEAAVRKAQEEFAAVPLQQAALTTPGSPMSTVPEAIYYDLSRPLASESYVASFREAINWKSPQFEVMRRALEDAAKMDEQVQRAFENTAKIDAQMRKALERAFLDTAKIDEQMRKAVERAFSPQEGSARRAIRALIEKNPHGTAEAPQNAESPAETTHQGDDSINEATTSRSEADHT